MATLFTAGHSNRSAEQLGTLLQGAGIALLVDVRRFPGSRRHPWFGRDALQASLEGLGIGYRWLGEELGGRRQALLPLERSPNRAWDEPAFRNVADALDTPGFQAQATELERLAGEHTVCLLCAERDWRRCHRQILADWLVTRGWQVVHLLDPQTREPHRLSPTARVEAGRLSYPTLL
jgi:uncharacterized protein (DUF488 family)